MLVTSDLGHSYVKSISRDFHGASAEGQIRGRLVIRLERTIGRTVSFSQTDGYPLKSGSYLYVKETLRKRDCYRFKLKCEQAIYYSANKL